MQWKILDAGMVRWIISPSVCALSPKILSIEKHAHSGGLEILIMLFV